jgi:AraC-like DNA-binding protein
MNIHRKQPSSSEFARFGYFEESLRVEVLHAKFDQHVFATHTHDTWAIGAVLSGAKDISAKRDPKQIVSADECYSVPPFRPHAGKSAADHTEYVMLYVPDVEWREQCSVYGVDPMLLSNAAWKQPRLAKNLASFVSLVLAHPEMLARWVGEWSVFCEAILSPYRHVESPRYSLPHGRVRNDPAISRAHEYLRQFWDKNVTLNDLAREASMSTYELCRRFPIAYGLTPHRYQLVLRVMKAKAALLQGAGISEVASDTGFSDQSHLGRHFKSVFGLTPGAVLKEVERTKKR